MTPKMLEKCSEQMNITIGFNVDNIIFKLEIIIIASQSVLAVVFFAKYFVQTLKNMSIGGQILISVISVVLVCSSNQQATES